MWAQILQEVVLSLHIPLFNLTHVPASLQPENKCPASWKM